MKGKHQAKQHVYTKRTISWLLISASLLSAKINLSNIKKYTSYILLLGATYANVACMQPNDYIPPTTPDKVYTTQRKCDASDEAKLNQILTDHGVKNRKRMLGGDIRMIQYWSNPMVSDLNLQIQQIFYGLEFGQKCAELSNCYFSEEKQGQLFYQFKALCDNHLQFSAQKIILDLRLTNHFDSQTVARLPVGNETRPYKLEERKSFAERLCKTKDYLSWGHSMFKGWDKEHANQADDFALIQVILKGVKSLNELNGSLAEIVRRTDEAVPEDSKDLATFIKLKSDLTKMCQTFDDAEPFTYCAEQKDQRVEEACVYIRSTEVPQPK